MAKEAIHLLFDVEGGDGIDAGSGKLIVTQLTEIIKKINDGKNVIPKVKIDFDMTETENKLKDIKKQIKDVVKALEEPSGEPGKGGGKKKSDDKNIFRDYKQRTADVKRYYSAIKELQSIQLKTNKVTRDASGIWSSQDDNYKERIEHVNSLKNHIDELGVAEVNAAKSSDEANQIKVKKADELGLSLNQYQSLLNQVSNAEQQRAVDYERASQKIQEAAKKEVDAKKKADDKEKDSEDNKKSAEGQSKRITLIKDYYKARIELEKIVKRSHDVIRKEDGSFEATGEKYKLLVERVNQLKAAYDALGLSVEDNRFEAITEEDGKKKIVPNENFGHSEAYKNANGDLEELKETAEKLNLTTEEYIELIQTADNAVRDLASAEDKDSTEKRWANNIGKAATLLEDLEGKRAGQRDTGVGKLMNELRELSRSGDISNLDKLTQKMDEVRIAAAKAGVDVDTWGTKMLKTLGGKLRSALAGFAVGKASQYLREVYHNVVELDSAITDLQIASGKTREETEHLIKSYSKLGKEIGATTIEVAKSADTFLRQGYSVEQTETLIKNSMMLSKLGQIESAEAAKALTSAMKGYKVEVEDTIGIVDKFTAVDMVAAVSAGDLATAMAETATGADIAGVSMDKLVGYIATVSEVTQDGAESVGTFYKTLFARMNNVKAEKFVDDETGESLNDVEKVLGELNISLRDSNGLFRNSGEVLDEVGQKWETFDNVQQHAIATAFAGKRVPVCTEMCA